MNYKLFLILLGLLFLINPSSATLWAQDSDIVNGLPVGTKDFTIFKLNGLPSVIITGTDAYQWNGSTWNQNLTLINGLDSMYRSPTAYWDGAQLNILYWNDLYDYGVVGYAEVTGFTWSGTVWTENNSIIAGLLSLNAVIDSNDDMGTSFTVINDGSIVLVGNNYTSGAFVYKWNGSSWNLNNSLKVGLPSNFKLSQPTLWNDGERKLTYFDKLAAPFAHNIGYIWNGTSWNLNNSNTVYGTADVGRLQVFNSSGTWTAIAMYETYPTRGFYLYSNIPTLYTPTNQSTVYTTYPPLIYDVTFTWSNLQFEEQYRIQIARDPYFNLMSVDTHVGTNYSTQSLRVNDEYFWRVYSYDGSTYSTSSEIFSFNLTGNVSVTGSIVYGSINSEVGLLSNVEVIISNAAEGVIDTQLTGSNGYYQFTDLTPGTIYTLSVSKDLYLSTSANFNATANPTVKEFYLLPDHTSEEWRHFVTFKVMNIFGTGYANIDTTVYKNGLFDEYTSGTTNSQGKVTFIMEKNQNYRLTFINSTQGISKTYYVYPSKTEYWIIIATTLPPWNDYDKSPAETITANVTINDYSVALAYINVTYTSTLAGTTGLMVYLNQTNPEDPQNQTVIDSWNGGAGDTNFHSFALGTHSGESYVVHVQATHSTYGVVHRNYAVMFPMTGMYDGIPQWTWLYLGIFLMFITGGLALATAPEEGAIVVCAEGWIFFALGWFQYIGTAAIAIGLTVATVLAVLAYLSKKDKESAQQ